MKKSTKTQSTQNKYQIHTTPQSANLFWQEAVGLSCPEGSENDRLNVKVSRGDI